VTNQRFGLRIASLIFALIAIVHVIRMVVGLQIQIGAQTIPMWPSAVAAVLFGVLAVWFWRLANRSA
jgi:hypothetical protein